MKDIFFKDLPKKYQQAYSWLDEDAKNYPLEWDRRSAIPVLRFKRNPCVDFLTQENTGVRYLNDMWVKALAEKWPWKEIRHFYRLMGYSLSGYGDVFYDDERMS